jgi:hypothetical protein
MKNAVSDKFNSLAMVCINNVVKHFGAPAGAASALTLSITGDMLYLCPGMLLTTFRGSTMLMLSKNDGSLSSQLFAKKIATTASQYFNNFWETR